MRVGMFGGTFDPVHYGHLLLAEQCREQWGLDQVWFVPAATPPHKRSRVLTEGKHRIEMLRLATHGNPAFHLSRVEVDRGGVSYTVDTLRQLRAELPEAEWFLLLGADSLVDLPSWREPGEILRLANPLVARRQGSPINWAPLALLASAERFAQFTQYVVDMPLIELSSTAIRDAVASGKSIRYQIPPAVEQYIRTHGLYGSR